MSRLVAIEPRGTAAAVALVEDGVLTDLYVDPAEADDFAPEAIHLVRVKRLIPGQGGAHVKMAGGAKGFLRDAKGLAEGQLVIAEVAGVSGPGKGTPLTMRPLLKGRLAILTPGAPGANVARSVKGEARARLAEIARTVAPEGDGAPGLILRSAAAEAEAEEIAEDVAALAEIWRAVEDGAATREIGLLAEAPDAVTRAIRDWAAPDEVVEEQGAFDRLGLWDAIDALADPAAPLPGGGRLIIQPTAALVAVDVDTGGDLTAGAAKRANMAACADLPRQLRLRGLGGQVTVDFAPLRKADRKAVEAGLRAGFTAEGAGAVLAGWTPLGLFELTRKRDRRPLKELLNG